MPKPIGIAKLNEKAPVIAWAIDRAHQWTNRDGEILILRCCDVDGNSYGGFQWPLIVGATVTPDFWVEDSSCGYGLHGWPLGLGLGDGKDPDWGGKWIVFSAAPGDVIGNLDGEMKCKTKSGTVRFVGAWDDAMKFILPEQMKFIAAITDGSGKHSEGPSSASSATGCRSASSATGYSSASSATGDSSASSATGYRSASSATGYRSASSATGDSSASSATGPSSASSATGYSSASSATGPSSASSATGDRSASSATGPSSASSATGYRSASSATGYRSASSATGPSSASSATGPSSASSATGDSSASSATEDSSAAVVTGLYGKAMAGKFGCIALAFWNQEEKRAEMRCAVTGDGTDDKLKPNVWYGLDAFGVFEEVK